MHVFLEPGELLAGAHDRAFYRFAWEMARADSFQPVATASPAGGMLAPYRVDRLST